MAQATNNKSLRYAGIQSRRFAAGSRLPRLQHRRTNLCCFLLLLIGVPIPREHLVRDQCLAAEGAIGTTASLRNRPLHQQWHDGPGWVGITGSKNEEAVVRCHQRLKDRLPAYCRPRSPFRPMAGLADEGSHDSSKDQSCWLPSSQRVIVKFPRKPHHPLIALAQNGHKDRSAAILDNCSPKPAVPVIRGK